MQKMVAVASPTTMYSIDDGRLQDWIAKPTTMHLSNVIVVAQIHSGCIA